MGDEHNGFAGLTSEERQKISTAIQAALSFPVGALCARAKTNGSAVSDDMSLEVYVRQRQTNVKDYGLAVLHIRTDDGKERVIQVSSPNEEQLAGLLESPRLKDLFKQLVGISRLVKGSGDLEET